MPGHHRSSFDFGPVVISGTPRPHGGIATAYAPRRVVLDRILVDAAGTVVEARARVVVGADGWNSTVARAVGAARYHTRPVLQTAFYAYWDGLPVDGMLTVIRGDRGIAAIPTNDGATLVLVGCPYAQARHFRSDVENSYLAAIDRAPELAERVLAATRRGRIVAGGVPNFFRTPFGPGWALAGDAGYVKDPITAQGIADALTGAEHCADALHEFFADRRPFDEVMGEYQRQRDEHALPIYELTTQLATLEPPPPEMQQLLAAIAGNQPAIDDFVSVMAGTLSPAEFFDPANITSLLTGAG